VEQCGNGARAFVKFVSEKGLSDQAAISVETMAGIISPRLEADGSITVDMGAPVLEPQLVPFDASGLAGVAEGGDTVWPLDLALPGQAATVLVSVVSMGNPHAVQVVDDVDAQDLEASGPLIERHARFPRRVNAGYMQVLDRHHVKLRVYERGAGETLACGTGACAAAVAGIRRGLLDSPVRISARGGELSIAWQGEGQPVLMTGPAVTVFEGTIEL
ncbi:MAG: diaminopimelate epimerase, partial [Janthinobacterium sp.]